MWCRVKYRGIQYRGIPSRLLLRLVKFYLHVTEFYWDTVISVEITLS